MYSRGAAAIAEQIHSTKEEAQEIINNFYASFPAVKKWSEQSLIELKETGYTTDFYGRRRRLPDIKLDKYDFKLIKQPDVFNPLLECQNRSVEPSKELINKYKKIIDGCGYNIRKEFQNIQNQAKQDNIQIKDNQAFIAQAERQCVNSRIQGGAATMTKIAMIQIFNDPELKSYDFKLLIGVHDELIGQCKEEYADACAKRLCDIMKNCVSDIINVPFKCDPSIVKKWYWDEVAYEMQETYQTLLNEGKTQIEAETIIKNKNTEFLDSEIAELLNFKG